MIYIKETIERHIKTHTERAAEDIAAVTVLKTFMRSGGKIIPNFEEYDKRPNTDGTLELVPNPDLSRQPVQNFAVQIKGTRLSEEKDGTLSYSLKSLAFPAYVYREVTLDPSILFVILNPDIRGEERVFWKYVSSEFLSKINFENDSTTIKFTLDDEIKNTDESVNEFCDKLVKIANHHSFVKTLDARTYTKKDVEKIIKVRNIDITESIDRMDTVDTTRDNISRRMLSQLEDLCRATLLLNTIALGYESSDLRLALEKAMLDIDTKYLYVFLKGLKYIGGRIPEDGQSERLMLKYYDFLWEIRYFLHMKFNISVLDNLEKFPRELDELDNQYYEVVAHEIDSIDLTPRALCNSRFYIQKQIPFFVGKERYYEITLQLAGIYATKYNRITVYSKAYMSTNYSVQIAYTYAEIELWNIKSKIKVVTNWAVSIAPTCLNKLGKILLMPTKISVNYGEYGALMNFLTKTGINFLDFIDLNDDVFADIIDKIYIDSNTSRFKDILIKLKSDFCQTAMIRMGRNTIRYLLLNLREDTLENVMPFHKTLCDDLRLSTKCFPFERNPFTANLTGKKTSSGNHIRDIISIVGSNIYNKSLPYVVIRNAINETGELYFNLDSISSKDKVEEFNSSLDPWELKQGFKIKQEDGLVYIDSYEKTTIKILQRLLLASKKGNRGQEILNKRFLEENINSKFLKDNLKKSALKNIFVNSQVALIYGAAGTGKTVLINLISNLMAGKRKLFLTKTHTTLQNLKRRIENPGVDVEFRSIDSFTKKVNLPDFDIIFVDECSILDNKIMLDFLNKISDDTFIVLAGDIYQIESIDFGNWFYYAKDIIKSKGANIELLNTWRTEDEAIKELWHEVRTKSPLITEKLAMDGPFSEDIGENIFDKLDEDEIVLCLNYDGKFGLNNINNYFQNANKNAVSVIWQEWIYKVGDPILFNNSKRFPLLYNNLKGWIVNIDTYHNSIKFTIDVAEIITEAHCKATDVEWVDIIGDDKTRISFEIYLYDETADEDENKMMYSIIPFQIAYAVSIHKAQGLEYNSVKVIIPNINSEKISHGVFYTAITRTKEKLKIYWSSETMQKIVSDFNKIPNKSNSLEIIKNKL